jgi:hypothetical protein
VSSPAAWLPDPTGAHDHRWWDGERWTEHVADAGTASVDPLASGDEPPAPGAEPGSSDAASDAATTDAGAGDTGTAATDQGWAGGSSTDQFGRPAAEATPGEGQDATAAGAQPGGEPTWGQQPDQGTGEQPAADPGMGQGWGQQPAAGSGPAGQDPAWGQPPGQGAPSAGQAPGWNQPQAGGQPPAWGQQPAGQAPGMWGTPAGAGAGQPPAGNDGMAVAALVIGILSLLVAWIPFIGVLGAVGGIVAAILGFVARGRIKRTGRAGRGMATGGIVTGIIAVVLGILITVGLFALGGNLFGETFRSYAECIQETGDQDFCEEQLERDVFDILDN